VLFNLALVFQITWEITFEWIYRIFRRDGRGGRRFARSALVWMGALRTKHRRWLDGRGRSRLLFGNRSRSGHGGDVRQVFLFRFFLLFPRRRSRGNVNRQNVCISGANLDCVGRTLLFLLFCLFQTLRAILRVTIVSSCHVRVWLLIIVFQVWLCIWRIGARRGGGRGQTRVTWGRVATGGCAVKGTVCTASTVTTGARERTRPRWGGRRHRGWRGERGTRGRAQTSRRFDRQILLIPEKWINRVWLSFHFSSFC